MPAVEMQTAKDLCLRVSNHSWSLGIVFCSPTSQFTMANLYCCKKNVEIGKMFFFISFCIERLSLTVSKINVNAYAKPIFESRSII